MADSDSIKLCECGCGRRTSGRRGIRYVSGHNPPTNRGTHRMTGTPEFKAWESMRERCLNPKHRSWKNYGGRGIRVCERWSTFQNFYSDLGPRPSSEHSLDRIDVNGNYEPENCRWAVEATQKNNRRDNVFVYSEGRTLTLSQWARELSLPPQLLIQRYGRGMRPPKLLSGRLYRRKSAPAWCGR